MMYIMRKETAAEPVSAYYRAWVHSRRENMDRKRINSSRIRSAGYDPKSQVLEIEFNDGRITGYRGVSPEVYRQFTNAPSPVSFFEDKIAENYPETRVK